jgi:lysophospholipase L1-like esterase
MNMKKSIETTMMNRRAFVTGCAVAAAAATTRTATAADASVNHPSGVPGYGYRLPGFRKGSLILFQGDSITDMNWGRKQQDRNHYLGHSYVYLIAARLGVDLARQRLDILTRGISGSAVANLRQRWQTDAIDMKPDLLSILIGTNDVNLGVQPDAFEADYRWILDASRKANPGLRLVLLDPFVLRSGSLASDPAWTTRRSATDRMRVVVARLAKDYDAVHVRTQDVFDRAAEADSPEQWIWDGVHPLSPRPRTDRPQLAARSQRPLAAGVIGGWPSRMWAPTFRQLRSERRVAWRPVLTWRRARGCSWLLARSQN